MGAIAFSMMADAVAPETIHRGQGMSGDNAYSEVKFTNASDNSQTATAKAVYTLTPTDDNKLDIKVSFENLDPNTFIGLVDACYCLIPGVGETALTLSGTEYTGTTAGTFTTGTEYKDCFFKRMSSGAYYGGDLLFYFDFTYSNGETPEPVTQEGDLWPTAEPTLKEVYYADANWTPFGDVTAADVVKISADGITVDLPHATAQQWQAQVKIDTKINFIPENTYYFDFDVKSSTTFNGVVKFQPAGDDNNFYLGTDGGLELKAGEVVKFRSDALTGKTINPAMLLFDFGTCPENTKIEITNIHLYVGERPEEPQPGVEVPEHLYLVGAIEGSVWTPEATPEMTKDGNVFTLKNVSMTGDSNFSFLTVLGSWSDLDNTTRYGAATDGEVVTPGTPATIVKAQGNVGAFKLAEAGKYDFTVDFDTMTVDVVKLQEDAIETVDADSNAAVEYFTLQGVRVAEPAAGSIVICRRGTEVSKILVK